jgi:hypothetical protein
VHTVSLSPGSGLAQRNAPPEDDRKRTAPEPTRLAPVALSPAPVRARGTGALSMPPRQPLRQTLTPRNANLNPVNPNPALCDIAERDAVVPHSDLLSTFRTNSASRTDGSKCLNPVKLPDLDRLECKEPRTRQDLARSLSRIRRW